MQLDINGVVCQYAQAGEGRDVLLLHGWGCDHSTWGPVYEQLRGYCRVTAIDFPGHGQSGSPPETGWHVADFREWTRAFIEEAGLQGCDIVAHSFGGRVALQLAAEYPSLVGRLLFTGAAGLKPKRSLAFRARASMVKAAKACALWLPGGEKLREKARERFGSADYRALAPELRNTFVNVIEEDQAPYLERIQAETLLLWGRDDTETPLWMGREMEARIPGAALVVMENAGHYAFLEKPYEFLKIMDAFLKR